MSGRDFAAKAAKHPSARKDVPLHSLGGMSAVGRAFMRRDLTSERKSLWVRVVRVLVWKGGGFGDLSMCPLRRRLVARMGRQIVFVSPM
jgi:hypothetical protein